MSTDVAHGTQTAVINTEHTLFDSSAAGTYELTVDRVNMANGDILELRAYKMALTAGTRRAYILGRWADAEQTDDTMSVSIPVSTGLADSGAVRFTLKQIAGTGRNFDWNVESFP